MRPDDDGLFIIHMLDPVAIIQVDEEHMSFDDGKYYEHYSYQGKDFTLSVYFLFTKELDSEQHSKITEHMMDRAWRWFISYIKWEDKQHE